MAGALHTAYSPDKFLIISYDEVISCLPSLTLSLSELKGGVSHPPATLLGVEYPAEQCLHRSMVKDLTDPYIHSSISPQQYTS